MGVIGWLAGEPPERERQEIKERQASHEEWLAKRTAANSGWVNQVWNRDQGGPLNLIRAIDARFAQIEATQAEIIDIVRTLAPDKIAEDPLKAQFAWADTYLAEHPGTSYGDIADAWRSEHG